MPSELLGKKILIVVSGGPENPERCVGPFFFANSAARSKAEVSMLFVMGGSILLKQGIAETICAREGGRPVRVFLDDCLKSGVKLYVCAASLKLNDMV
ncbi:MAG TPA: DsrE family protein, partial [Anaerolineales bacterium]|nr:DsrE family protein [Anaerolineales bacterium]